ncbi:hypothetical protein YC2023_016195 [Brassica napus]
MPLLNLYVSGGGGGTGFGSITRQSTLDRFIARADLKPPPPDPQVVSDPSFECGNNDSVGIDPETAKTCIYPVNVPLRDYQFAITKTALFSNTLVALPTRLGKTLTTAFVISHELQWQHRANIRISSFCALRSSSSSPSVREMVLHLQHSEPPPLLALASLRNGLCGFVVLQAGVANALIQHQWRPKSFITVSGEVDSRAIEKSAKIGKKRACTQIPQIREGRAGDMTQQGEYINSATKGRELHSVRSQLAAEQSRCFKLELEVAEDHKSSSSKILLKMPSKCEILCEILIAILLPPLGVCLSRGCCTVEFLICLVLTIVRYVPGIIYALYVIVFQKQEEYFNEARRPLYYSA